MTFWKCTNQVGAAGSNVAITTKDADSDFGPSAISVIAGGSLTYDSAHALPGYDVSVKASVGGTSGATYEEFITGLTLPIIASSCVYVPSAPSVTTRLVTSFTSAGALKGDIAISPAGVITIFDSVGGIGNMTVAGAAIYGKWVRFDLRIITNSATVGQFEAKYFADPFSATVSETKLSTAAGNTLTTVMGGSRFGIMPSMTSSDLWTAYKQWSSTTTAPPPVPAARYRGWGVQL